MTKGKGEQIKQIYKPFNTYLLIKKQKSNHEQFLQSKVTERNILCAKSEGRRRPSEYV
jgi:hypothetical protein